MQFLDKIYNQKHTKRTKMYDLNMPEEELKNKVAQDFFGDFGCTQILGEIDFCVSFERQSLYQNTYFLWAEAKKGGDSNIYKSFTQLVLTIAKNKHHQKHIPPPFLGAFDCEKFAVIAYNKIMDFLDKTDFDYSHTTPSNHESANFQKMHALVKPILENETLLFSFDTNNAQLREFIATNFILGNDNLSQIQITEDNFVHIYIKWLNAVKPSIDIDWDLAKKQGILDTDFYLADMLSDENKTLKDKLYILLKDSHYELLRGKNKIGLFEKSEVDFNDNQKAHKQFWNAYERPPKEKFWNSFINRRDLLVPEDIRERKGAFYTPQVWVQKAQEYLADCLGENWQDEYYIWDCAAGTGNLLAGLKNARNIFASTLDIADVNIIKDLVRTQEKSIKLHLLENHIFQFDFLNDEFFDKVDKKSGEILAESKLPKRLQEIIKNESQKLVIFINPPYAEAATKQTIAYTGQNKSGVSNTTKIYERYFPLVGTAIRELFAQFFIRIYVEIPNCILGSFSTLKYINAQYYDKFKQEFKAKFLKGFAVPADSFDNVNGQFPIGFLVWNLAEKMSIKKIKIDFFNQNNKKMCKKSFYNIPKNKYIIDWLKNFHDKQGERLAYLRMQGTDMQHNNGIFIASDLSPNDFKKHLFSIITKYNVVPFCVYFAVRHAIKSSWINDRDQFLYPNKKWRQDAEFHSDCLAYALFHAQNRISAKSTKNCHIEQSEISQSKNDRDASAFTKPQYDKNSGCINHFIPFSETQVGAKEAFRSDFILRFINGKVQNGTLLDCFVPNEKITFSSEAMAVFNAGLELWRYYHAQAKSSEKYLNDASLYDIKEYFQGRVESKNGKQGKLNARSEDSHYNDLLANLRLGLQDLAKKIQPKIYEYEFLLE